MDQGAVEGDIDGASDGRSNGWYKRSITKQSKEIWIRKLSKERWMVQAMEGEMDGTSDGSGSSRTNVQAMDQGAIEGDIDGASDERAIDGTSD